MIRDFENFEKLELIRNTVPLPAQYEQLAEECAELAHAALKMSRKLRGENYTPALVDDIRESLEEEFNDVLLSAQTCYLYEDKDIITKKLNRWIKRVTNS